MEVNETVPGKEGQPASPATDGRSESDSMANTKEALVKVNVSLNRLCALMATQDDGTVLFSHLEFQLDLDPDKREIRRQVLGSISPCLA